MYHKMKWFKYLTKKEKRNFYWITALNGTFFIGGIVMLCFGMYSGVYGFILLITYVPFYDGKQRLGEIRGERFE